jgi:predicted permease
VVAVVLTIALSTAAGVLAERRWRDRAATLGRRLLLIALYTVLPFVTFFNVAALDLDLDLSAGVGLGWLALALAAALAYGVARGPLRLERPAVGGVVCSTLVANTGYLGYPLVLTLLGEEAIGEAVVYDVAVSAPALLLAGFATGAAFGTRAGQGLRERTAAFFTRNPPLLAALAGLFAPHSLAPEALVDASRLLVIALLPLGFFVVGSVLEEESQEGGLRLPPPLSAPVAAIVLTRLVVAPGLLYLLALPLIELPDAYLLLAAMPCGINTLIVAHAYGLDSRITAEALAWTTGIAVCVALGSLAL